MQTHPATALLLAALVIAAVACSGMDGPARGEPAADGWADAPSPADLLPIAEDGRAPDNSAAEIATGPGPILEPFQPGPHGVTTIARPHEKGGPPIDIDLYVPDGEGPFAVVLFMHGFLLDKAWYSTLLTHVASHGFVVVAGQSYPADGIPLAKPTAYEEADTIAALLNWLDAELPGAVGVAVDLQRLGLAGHSRGGKVAWILRHQDPHRFLACAGLDPVDGTGGPLGGEERILEQTFNDGLPSLVIGTELGAVLTDVGFGEPMACAPEGDNHDRFYTASPHPAWHALVLEHGHNDMLNTDAECGLLCDLCPGGPDPVGVATLCGGLLATFFSATLDGQAGSSLDLAALPDAPLATVWENK